MENGNLHSEKLNKLAAGNGLVRLEQPGGLRCDLEWGILSRGVPTSSQEEPGSKEKQLTGTDREAETRHKWFLKPAVEGDMPNSCLGCSGGIQSHPQPHPGSSWSPSSLPCNTPPQPKPVPGDSVLLNQIMSGMMAPSWRCTESILPPKHLCRTYCVITTLQMLYI